MNDNYRIGHYSAEKEQKGKKNFFDRNNKLKINCHSKGFFVKTNCRTNKALKACSLPYFTQNEISLSNAKLLASLVKFRRFSAFKRVAILSSHLSRTSRLSGGAHTYRRSHGHTRGRLGHTRTRLGHTPEAHRYQRDGTIRVRPDTRALRRKGSVTRCTRSFGGHVASPRTGAELRPVGRFTRGQTHFIDTFSPMKRISFHP